MFQTQKTWQLKVEGLEARITELESDVTASAEALTSAQNELATATETITAHVAEIDKLTARQTELETELTTANEAIEAANAAKEAAEKSAGAKASEMLASVGHAAVEVTTEDQSKTTLSRESFRNLKSHEQNKFIRDGGKLTE